MSDSIDEFVFPLEAVLEFGYPTPVPLQVVQRLWGLCPEGVSEQNDSRALYLACTNRFFSTDGPDIVLSILRANLALAATYPQYYSAYEEAGVPLSRAVRSPFADQVLPALIQAYPEALAETNNLGKIPLIVDSKTVTYRRLLCESCWKKANVIKWDRILSVVKSFRIMNILVTTSLKGRPWPTFNFKPPWPWKEWK